MIDHRFAVPRGVERARPGVRGALRPVRTMRVHFKRRQQRESNLAHAARKAAVDLPRQLTAHQARGCRGRRWRDSKNRRQQEQQGITHAPPSVPRWPPEPHSAARSRAPKLCSALPHLDRV